MGLVMWDEKCQVWYMDNGTHDLNHGFSSAATPISQGP